MQLGCEDRGEPEDTYFAQNGTYGANGDLWQGVNDPDNLLKSEPTNYTIVGATTGYSITGIGDCAGGKMNPNPVTYGTLP